MTCLAITEFSCVRQWCHVSFSVASVLVDQWSTRAGTLPPTTRPTSRRPTPERYTKNAASYLRPVCMLSTKLLVPGAGDAHVHPRGAGDNKARFFLTRILP